LARRAARSTPYGRLLVDAFIDAIISDPAFDGGWYREPDAVHRGLRRHARLFAATGFSARLFNEALWTKLGFSSTDDFVAGFVENHFLPQDPNNLVALLRKWRLEGQPKRRAGWGHKNTVFTLVERGGSARSFHVDSTTIANIAPIVRANVAHETALMTDEARQYLEVGTEFASHESVNHSQKEYVRGHVHTNTVEGYYSIFKRGMKGIYQHCSEKHLYRYLAEYDFRYSNRIRLGCDDVERTERAIKGIVGKRLTYRTTHN
jgi:ISXO2-like transposase domain